jgi:protein tyrosine phosphatase (PTP) superfamily phosphohydrolase (DUF442 family)
MATSDPSDIYNWQRLDETITTSGQPSEAQLAAIRDLGVTHVVNLGLHSHERALPDEAASVVALGMRYTHIPVDFDAPTEADFARFCAVMETAGEEPTHVHCIANMRVSAFFYRYRRDLLGWDEGLARAAMEALWRPGGVWASFIGDESAAQLSHRGPREKI